MSATVVLERVSHAFGEGALRRQVLDAVSVAVQAGEIVLLTGPSGSGKTTLLTLIGALRTVQEGRVEVLGHRLDGVDAAALGEVRRRIGFVFQSHNLLEALSARENVELALEIHPELSDAERRRRAIEALEHVDLGGHLEASPRRLSGGQRQRVALARALAARPGLLLADEPTASLDRDTGREVIERIRALAKEQGASVLLVTHDERILDMADRIVHLEDGALRSYATAVATMTGLRLASLATTALGRHDLFEHLEDLSTERFAEVVEEITAETRAVRDAVRLGQSAAYVRILDQVLDAFTRKTGQLLDAERSSLFWVDGEAGELRSKYASAGGDDEQVMIRIPLSRGVAGAVATGGRTRNLADAYADPAFDPSVDRETGFRTRSLLCVPIRGSRGDVVAVAQVLNRRDGRPFDQTDEDELERLTAPMGVVLESWKAMVRPAPSTPPRATPSR